MNRGKWFLLWASIVLLALAGAAFTGLPRIAAKKPRTQTVAQQAQPQLAEVSLSGKIRPQNVLNVAPPVEGIVGALFVDAGQQVFAGQLLARITNGGLEAGQQMAKQIVDNAQVRVNTLESEIIAARLEASRSSADASRARSEYDRLEKTFRRQQMLLAEGATPKLTYDKSSREFDVAQSEYRTQAQVATQAESHLNELIKSLDAEKRALADKTADLETAKTRAGATELVSPAQGMVVGRNS